MSEPNGGAWEETARHYASSADYYRGLLEQIGAHFGDAAKTADDGSLSDDILCAKLPELVAALSAEKAVFTETGGMDERPEFENFYGFTPRRRPDGRYYNQEPQRAWEAWQARAAFRPVTVGAAEGEEARFEKWWLTAEVHEDATDAKEAAWFGWEARAVLTASPASPLPPERP